MTVVFMMLSLSAPDVLADETRNDKEEIFVVDMEDVCCVKLKVELSHPRTSVQNKRKI